ncbi:MAG TPA: VOC family protein [Caulobacteraceae bacterium]
MTNNPRPSMSCGLACRDPKAQLKWLEQAFGFEITMVVENPDGSIGHSEMRLGDGIVYVGAEWDERHRSPASMGGINTQSIHMQLPSGLDAHCERARAAGAVIVREPEDQFYGDRNYAAIDPEGHVWTFGQTVKTLTLEEMTQASGLSIRTEL